MQAVCKVYSDLTSESAVHLAMNTIFV